MPMPLGLWDKTALNKGWFDECGQAEGWFDADLLTAGVVVGAVNVALVGQTISITQGALANTKAKVVSGQLIPFAQGTISSINRLFFKNS